MKLLGRGKPKGIAAVAVARELAGFIWALGREVSPDIKRPTPHSRAFAAGTGTRADEGEPSAQLGGKSSRRTRVLRTRQLPTDHCHAVRTETREYQHDHRRDPLILVPAASGASRSPAGQPSAPACG
jgi:hypothetical protein